MGRKDLSASVLTKRPPFPFEIEYLWDLFNEFAWGLKADGMGPVMASWTDLRSWRLEFGHQLQQWEKFALIRLASARAAVVAEKQKDAIPKDAASST